MRQRIRWTVLAVLVAASLAVPGISTASPTKASSPLERAREALGVEKLTVHRITATEAARGMGEVGILAYEAPRECDDWYFSNGGNDYRLSHCTNPYFVQDVVKAHAKLHLYYRTSPTGSWLTPASVDSITINAWTLYKWTGTTPIQYPRATQSRGAGPAIADFYSAGVGIACGGGWEAWSSNEAESVRLANGTAFLGPGGAPEFVISGTYPRPC